MAQKRAASLDRFNGLPVMIAGAAVAFFFTQGLPLWNDDYSQWIAQANGSFLTLIARILLPITWEPLTWGYSDRPIEILSYKILHGIFGTWGTGYFFVKSVGFGALCWTMARWMSRLGVSRAVTWLSLGIFALSANVVASLIWHSDFGIYSQLILAFVLLETARKLPSIRVSNKNFLRQFGIFFAMVYFGTKLKGDVRLVPLILLAYLGLTDRARLRELAPWLGGTFLATLPWSATFFKHLPPFLGGAGYSGWTYGNFSVSQLMDFLVRDVFSFSATPLSLLGALGLLPLAAIAVYLGRRASREKELGKPSSDVILLATWLGFAVLALGTVSPQNRTFELRYTLVSLVPAVLLLAYGLEAVRRELGDVPAIGRKLEIALIAVLALQCFLQFRHSSRHRLEMGHTIVAIDRMFEAVETKHPDSQLVIGPGFLNYAYRDTKAQAILNRQQISDISEIGRFPAQNTYSASWTPTLDTRFAVDTFASGCATSLFDLLSRVMGQCGANDGAFLLKYVGNVPELAAADAMDKKGDLRGARQTLQSYWNREPGNHGAAFILGLYNYRLSDFAAMERVYDGFGSHFQGHASVVYNWALAKQGTQKFAEAVALFERAYALAPTDYGIGFNLSETYYRLGKKSRALATVTELLKAYPQNEALTRAKQHYANP
jgi:hypothetical protein